MSEKQGLSFKYFSIFIAIFALLLFSSSCLKIKTPATLIASGRMDAIIADHIAVEQFDLIPDKWIEKAKELTFHYAHTSHGSQIISGLLILESMDPKYNVAVITSASIVSLPPMEDPPAFRIYDGNPPKKYINPNDYWDGENALNKTRAVANTGLFN